MGICQRCRSQISVRAAFCPSCGNLQITQPKGVKRPLTWVVVILGGVFAISQFQTGDSKSIGQVATKSGRENLGSAQVSDLPAPASKEAALLAVKLDFKGHIDGVVLLVSFTIHNNGPNDIKDFEITCKHVAKSNTVIDENTRTIYDIVKAHSTKKFPNFNMGFVNSQAVATACLITDLKL